MRSPDPDRGTDPEGGSQQADQAANRGGARTASPRAARVADADRRRESAADPHRRCRPPDRRARAGGDRPRMPERGAMPAPARRRRFLGWAVAIWRDRGVRWRVLVARSVYSSDGQPGRRRGLQSLPYARARDQSLGARSPAVGTLEERQKAVGHTLPEEAATGLPTTSASPRSSATARTGGTQQSGANSKAQQAKKS
jgi:hypothetical protein